MPSRRGTGGSWPGRPERGYVADRLGVAEIIAHELFDGQQAAGLPIPVGLGNAELFGAVEDFGGLSGVKMQLVAQSQEKFQRGLNGGQVFIDQNSHIGQFVEIGGAVTHESDPADELDFAAIPPLDRLTSGSKRKTVSPKRRRSTCLEALDLGCQQPFAAVDLPAEQAAESLVQMLAARQQLRIDQRGARIGVGHGLAAGLLRCANAVAEDQPGVEYVAQQRSAKGATRPPRPRG